MRVLVAMSGGVDSSVAAALLRDQGHDVVGVTMKLWGGESDSGCCSVSDVDDARRVADHLGIDHHVFNFGDDFTADVIEPYVADHAAGRTPNPCIECNRHLKFDRLLRPGRRARLRPRRHRPPRPPRPRPGRRGRTSDGRADPAKDQSYVLYVVAGAVLDRVSFPIGGMTKADVRAEAARLGLAHRRQARQPGRVLHHLGRRADEASSTAGSTTRQVGWSTPSGATVGHVDAVELVTIGQRRGLDLGGTAAPRYAVDVDVRDRHRHHRRRRRSADRLGRRSATLVWAHDPVDGAVLVQCSAHGTPHPAIGGRDRRRCATVTFERPQRRLAPGQSVVLYRRRPRRRRRASPSSPPGSR